MAAKIDSAPPLVTEEFRSSATLMAKENPHLRSPSFICYTALVATRIKNPRVHAKINFSRVSGSDLAVYFADVLSITLVDNHAVG
jgi:hypothetical protein